MKNYTQIQETTLQLEEDSDVEIDEEDMIGILEEDKIQENDNIVTLTRQITSHTATAGH